MTDPVFRNFTGGENVSNESSISTTGYRPFGFNRFTDAMIMPRENMERHEVNRGVSLVLYVSARSSIPKDKQFERLESFCQDHNYVIAARLADDDPNDYHGLEQAIGKVLLTSAPVLLACDDACYGGFESFKTVSEALWRTGRAAVITDGQTMSRPRTWSDSKRSADRTRYNDMRRTAGDATYNGTRAVLFASSSSDETDRFSIDEQIVLLKDFCAGYGVNVIETISESFNLEAPLVDRVDLQTAVGSAILNKADYILVLMPSFLSRDKEEYVKMRIQLEWSRVMVRACVLRKDRDILYNPITEDVIAYENSLSSWSRKARILTDPDRGGDQDD